jgi:uncharacterized protein
MNAAPTNNLRVLEQTAEHVRALLADDASGHDWWHVDRVRRLALHIARREGADPYLVELAALLHDVADWKFHEGNEHLGPQRAAELLAGLGVDRTTIDHVAEIIAHVSFKGAGVATPMHTLEGACVQDADRLDALGAIGIARTFAYGGHAGQPMHDPELAPIAHATFHDYKTAGGTTINHFYEKLLLLKDRMQTATGRQLAEQRHTFMEQFLDRFHLEWRGEA